MSFRKQNSWGWTKPPLGSVLNRGHPLAHGQILHLPLNGGGGSKIVNIGDGPGVASLTSGTSGGDQMAAIGSPSWKIGKFGQDITLDGSTQYIDGGGYFKANFTTTDKFSGAAWINLSSVAQVVSAIIDRATDNHGWSFNTLHRATLKSTSVCFYASNTAGTNYIEANCGAVLSANVLYFVGFSYDGSGTAGGIKLYLNGRLQTATITNNTNPNPISGTARRLFVGGRNTTPASALLPGTLWGVRLWARMVTATEFMWLFKEPNADIVVPRRRIISLSAGTTSLIKTRDGIAIANVKTMDGIPIASVKTWNGIANA